MGRLIQLHTPAPSEPTEPPPSSREFGATGQTDYANLVLPEYNPDLRGVMGIKVYDQMRRSDAQVRGTLRLVKAPITSALWYIDPATPDPGDKLVADFISWNLFEALDRSFIQILWEALLMLDFGFFAFEPVYELGEWQPEKTTDRERPRPREVVKWRKFGSRHPMTLNRWQFDEKGEVEGMWQNTWANFKYQLTFIPAAKLLIFTLDEEAGDPNGMSVLRSAYKHWYYKDNLYRVDAIQKERHGIGIPVVHLPPNFSPEDVSKADEMGRNLRTNEQAQVTLPPNWQIEMLAMNTNLVNALASAEHHDLMIARNVLGQFINLASGGSSGGSRAVSSSMTDIFMKALRYMADVIRAPFNAEIKRLVDFNFPNVHSYPELRARRIGENADWRALSVAMMNLVNAGVLTATPELEVWVADQMDLPQPSQDALERSMEDRQKKPPQPGQGPTANPTASGNPSSEKANAAAGKSRTGGPKET